MSRPLRIEYPGALYHVTSRGNERKNIYASNKDREKFLEIINNAYKRFKAIIHAYCLMTNHYHLLIETPKANLSKCMQYINSTYTNYFNRERKRYGHLFQHRYLGLLVEEDSYLICLSRYIHLNPVRADMVKKPEEYKWSSYHHYISHRDDPAFLEKSKTLAFFKGDIEKYKEYVEEGIFQEIKNPLSEAFAGLVLGSDKFVDEIKRNYIQKDKKKRDLPSLRIINNDILKPANIIRIVGQYQSFSDKERIKLMVYFMRNYTDLTLEEISGKMTGINRISATAACKIVKRIEKRINEDIAFSKIVNDIELKMANGEA